MQYDGFTHAPPNAIETETLSAAVTSTTTILLDVVVMHINLFSPRKKNQLLSGQKKQRLAGQKRKRRINHVKLEEDKTDTWTPHTEKSNRGGS